MTGYLIAEDILIGQGTEAVAVRLGEEFSTACVVQLLQQLNDLGCVLLQQFDSASADGESDLESLAIEFSHLDECLDSWDIRTFGRFCYAAFVLVVVEIVVILTNLEETIALEMYVLVNLEI